MPARPSNRPPILTLGATVLVLASLYLGREVLVPIALAILLAFLLGPAVDRLQKLRLGRVGPVILVVLLAFTILGGLGWLVASQLTQLAERLPDYQENILAKIEQIKGTGPLSESARENLEAIARELNEEQPAPEEGKAIPVAVREEGSILNRTMVAVQHLAKAALVVFLVIFMLLKRNDMSDRLIRLVGQRRITLTTKALDDAASRISRYLRRLCMVNAIHGTAVAVGLTLIGLEYALLSGFFAAVLRFVPYVGSWIAAVLPVTLSLAQYPDWTTALLVIGLFAVLDLLTGMVLEPVFLSRGVGVSEVGLLIAVAVWTWLWGPIGLLLATPLTVCFVVMAKYVPEMQFVNIMLSDETRIPPRVRFYQRLLAKDQDEAMQIVDSSLAEDDGPERVYDELLIPALYQIKRDRRLDEITVDDVDFVLDGIRQILDVLELRRPGPAAESEASAAADAAAGVADRELPGRVILGIPATDMADHLALRMLDQLGRPGSAYEIELLSDQLLLSEIMDRVEQTEPALVCIAALPPGNLTRSRYVVKRLRARFPGLRILVGRWGPDINLEHDESVLVSAGADRVTDSLVEASREVAARARLDPVPAASND